MNSRESASIVPHSGVGGCAPRPRKPRPAASRMASETPSAAWTISGARQLGRTVDDHQPQRPDAGDARGGDVVLGQFAERRGAHQPDVARQIDDRHRDDGVGEARARASATTRIASTRLGTAMIRSIDARDRRRRPATPPIAAEQAEDDADHERDAHHRQADEQRHPRAVDQPRQRVVAVAVGAEREAPRAARVPDRRRAHGVAKLLDRRMRRDEIGEDRDQRRSRDNDDEAEHRAAVLAERGPERGERRGLGENARPLRRSTAGMATSAAMADPRIDRAIEEVDDEVDEDRPRSRPASRRPAAPDSRAG